ncbi:MAG: DNA ligase D [Acidobacteria bacterium]|nr:DNA ligase D [Acidobacteriota bacterium]
MSLEEYARKRDFQRTPEPPPSRQGTRGEQRRFFVQRHDATRLHYDLRLELGGTLKSWAVPKGPTLDPGVKALAMQVEDHPLDYGPFEGNIPKGNYGAGSVMLWDYGDLEILEDIPAAEQLARGDLKLRLDGHKLRGTYALVRMKGRGKGNEWLLIKKRDEHAVPGWEVEEHAYSVKTGRTQEEIAAELPPRRAKTGASPRKPAAPKTASSRRKTASRKAAAAPSPGDLPGAVAAPMPDFLTPMMAQLASHPPAGERWVYEIKWDGVRALCFIQDGNLRIYSRTGNLYGRQFPELSVVPHFVGAREAILDGEIAVLDQQGRSSFELIQPRIHHADPNTIAHLARKSPVKLYLFDLLYWDGYDLRGVPLIDRKRALESILRETPRMQYSAHFTAPAEEMLEAARQAGIEGVIAKCVDAKYESRRSRSWMKIKVVNRQELVICGFTEGERDYFGSLALGVYEGDKLVYAGNVGTGFDDRNLPLLWSKLEPLITGRHPFAVRPPTPRKTTWVRPELVCEVKFAEWTRDGRLRAPVFVSLRTDKRPEECVRERAAEPAVEPRCPPEEHIVNAGRRAGPLLDASLKEAALEIGGRRLKFTNLNKVYWPRDGYTKRDLINYYDAVSELILPHLRDRPLSLKRYPNGIDEPHFFQKNIPEEYPDWLRIEPIYSSERGENIRYVIANDRATLLYLANLGCIDQNPMMSRIGSLDNPDFILLDLDPVECGFDRIVQAALLVRKVLERIGLQGYPKTTGGDGMHVYIPVEPRYTYDQARSFAEILSHLVLAEDPELFTTPRAVAKRRKGRVYFDYLQLASTKTISAPYVVRPRDGAPVATPLDWKEVKRGLTPEQFTINNLLKRFERLGDLFAGVLKKPQKLELALERLATLAGDKEGRMHKTSLPPAALD